jgi:hypothetical protein
LPGTVAPALLRGPARPELGDWRARSRNTMRQALLLGLLALLPAAHALKVVVGPGKTECISEPVDSEHFEVGRRSRARRPARAPGSPGRPSGRVRQRHCSPRRPERGPRPRRRSRAAPGSRARP